MIIYALVKPNSSKNSLEKNEDGSYFIETMEKAQDGKANAAVVKMLAKEFNVSYKNIKIKNPKSKRKIIELKGLPFF